jgi:hypothetical protein
MAADSFRSHVFLPPRLMSAACFRHPGLARRKTMPVTELERWLGPWLGYQA